jgi:hypothetical protein
MDANLLDGSLTSVVNLIGAASGLGTAAMGLVDAMKAFGGGPSNFGFKFIRSAVHQFEPPTADGPAAFGWNEIEQTLKANWINGVTSADQKAKAKALIHLRLTKGDAPALAKVAGVDPDKLASVATKATNGDTVSPDEVAVLGQFDAVLSAVLDDAYERADQRYRKASKLLAAVVATLLAVAAGWIIYAQDSAGAADLRGYFGTSKFYLALLVGLSATPLAPVAKDLTSSLQAAASAVGTARKLVP